MQQPWQNRIVGYGEEAPDQLLANPRNARIHPKAQQDALGGVLREVGIVQNVIVNRITGMVVDGHARIALALRDNQPLIPITYVELTEAEEAVILATLDPIGAAAAWDRDKLDALLRDVTTSDAGVMALLAELAEEQGVTGMGAVAGDGGDDFDTTPDDGPTRCQLGDLWVIGGVHRLLVGDCTDAKNVARLMDGKRAAAVVTDSPYGINREGIANDDEMGLRGLFDGVLRCLPCDNAVVINFQSPRLFPVWVDAVRRAGHKFERALWFYDETDVTYPWRGWLMTSQIALVSSIGKPQWNDKGPYHHDCYMVKTAGKQNDSGGHTTAKPLDVVADLVAHTMGNVYDPFLGSGTTLIAAHRTGRRCYGMELAPKYCDVILRRAEAEGLTCERLDDDTLPFGPADQGNDKERKL